MTIEPGWPLALAVLGLLALTVTMYVVGGLPRPASAPVAAARAIAQLSVAALVIAAVVAHLALSLATVAVMFSIAVVTTTRRAGAARAWPWAALAMAAGLVPVLALILATRTIPLEGIALIPVAGILIGGAMTAHTLVCRRAFAALRDDADQYDARLALGHPREPAIRLLIHRHLPEALIPGMDQVRTAGVVTLPGAFIGVLLGGGSPAQAAAAQALVLVGLMAAQTTVAVVAERLIARALLLPADLRTDLHP